MSMKLRNLFQVCDCIDSSDQGQARFENFQKSISYLCLTQMFEIETKIGKLNTEKFIDETILCDINKHGSGMYSIQPDISFLGALNELFDKYQAEYPVSVHNNICKHGNTFCSSRALSALKKCLPTLPYCIAYDSELNKFVFDSDGMSDACVLFKHLLPTFASSMKTENSGDHEYDLLFSRSGDGFEDNNIKFELHVVSTGDEFDKESQIDVLYAKTV